MPIGDRSDCSAAVGTQEEREFGVELDAVMKDPKRENGA
jgi:hypothetical protein